MEKKMKAYKTLIRYITILIIFLFSNILLAEIQRMGIPKGTFKIQSDGTSRIHAYCMDYTREPPSSMDKFNFILTKNAKAFVRYHGKSLTLQEALDSNIINIHGKIFTFEEYIKMLMQQNNSPNIPLEEKKRNSVIIVAWQSATDDEKKSIDKFYTFYRLFELGVIYPRKDSLDIIDKILQAWPLLQDSSKKVLNKYLSPIFQRTRDGIKKHIAGLRDYQTLELTNNTNSLVEIVFENNLILGTQKENADWIVKMFDYNHLFQNQQKTWSILNNERLKVLEKLGFVSTDNKLIRGKHDREIFREAIRKYQIKKGLEQNGILDLRTEQELYKDYLKLLTE